MGKIQLYTIGFTKKSAEEFFDKLKQVRIKRVIDIRLRNTSQLAGFTKPADLSYFLKVVGKIDYQHILELAPTTEILKEYRQSGEWSIYEKKFTQLMQERKIAAKFSPQFLHQACLLCSEAKPTYCHRRLVAEYLQKQWQELEIKHL